jgi:hypothetical protein
MFGFNEKKTRMILDVSVSFNGLIKNLNEEYGLTSDDFEARSANEEERHYGVDFQLMDLGNNNLLVNFNGQFSFLSGSEFLLSRSFKVKPEKCYKIFEKIPRGEEPLASYREDSLKDDMYMGYLGLDWGEIIVTMKTFDEYLESDKKICSFPLLNFIKMNNVGFKKSRDLNFEEREKVNAKDTFSILGDDWEVADRHVLDCPKPRFEEVVESPYEDYVVYGKPPKNEAMSISLKFQYCD